MESSKTKQADLEKERTTFFLLGFTFILATLFVLFEWRSEESDYDFDWANINPTLLIEQELDNALLSVSESKTEAEEIIEPEKIHNQPIAYEDFNIVEKAVEPEEALHELFDAPPVPEDEPKALTEQTIKELSEQIYTEAEIMPQFPGGYVALNRFVFARLQYPASAFTQRIQGRVWCSFVVNKDGKIVDLKVERGVHIALDQETIRVLEQMPDWIPGAIRGQKVRVKVYLPIVFKL
ncbi:MAG: TonB family protein [Dysgonamonadaceae bacterium]|jgi:protein TonB|nr:TonB family protein [Dysgonamonadaceae bacterium]